MPDGTENTPGQEPNSTTTTASSGSRSIDEWPDEAKDYVRRLRDENAGHRNGNKELERQLKEYQDKDKTEAEKREEHERTLEGRATGAELKLLRYEVAAEKGLPLKYAARLQGLTKEELATDADALIKDFGLTGDGDPAPGGFDGGPRRPATSRPKTMNGLIRQQVERR